MGALKEHWRLRFLSNNHLDSYFIAPRCLRVALFPSPRCVYFEHILALVANPDTMSSDGSSEDQSHDIVIQTAILKVGDVESCSNVSLSRCMSCFSFPYHMCPAPSTMPRYAAGLTIDQRSYLYSQ